MYLRVSGISPCEYICPSNVLFQWIVKKNCKIQRDLCAFRVAIESVSAIGRSVGRCRSTSHCRKIAHSSSRNQRWNCFRLIRNCSKNIDRYPSHVVDVVGFDVVVECLHYFHYSKVVFHTKAAPSNVDVECASSVVAQRSNISHSHNICFCSASVFFPPISLRIWFGFCSQWIACIHFVRQSFSTNATNKKFSKYSRCMAMQNSCTQ